MSAILNTYNKKISFKKGKEVLYANNGKKYLDFVQGIAVNCLGIPTLFEQRSSKTIKKGLACFKCFYYPRARKIS